MRFSIIVPVYNVADYLSKCVDSILVQRCDSYEVILVDDGSTDGKCPALCDEIAAAHPDLVRVYHQSNGGLGAARNTGLRHAEGEYVFFVDSDDTIEPNTLEVLNRRIDETHADMYIFSFRYLKENGDSRPAEPRFSLLSGEPQTLNRCPDLLLDPPMACNRIVRRSLFENVEFPPRVWYEDLCTTPKLLQKAGSIVQLEDSFYVYLLRGGSIMRSSNLRRNLEIINALETVRSHFVSVEAFDRYRPWLCFLAVDSVLDAARRVLIADPKADYLPQFLGYVQKTYPDYRSCALLPRLGRKKLYLLKLLEEERYTFARNLFRLVKLIKRKG
jgi:glycosyltransferase involved in cell wall biosynthesis